MKVSKKRLIEIVTEEISRVRKEAYYRKYTPGGSPHRDLDPRHSPRRRRAPERTHVDVSPEPGPGDANYEQGKEDALAQRDNFDHTTATWKPGTSDNIQPNRPKPRSSAEDRAYMKGYMHYLYRKDSDEAMQEGYGDYERGASDESDYGAGDFSVQLDNAAGDGVDDAKMEVNEWGGIDDDSIRHNEKKYGSADAPSGRLGREYWEARIWARKELARGRRVHEESANG